MLKCLINAVTGQVGQTWGGLVRKGYVPWRWIEPQKTDLDTNQMQSRPSFLL
jgi:hypothetical protein